MSNMLLSCQWQKISNKCVSEHPGPLQRALWRKRRRFPNARIKVSRLFHRQFAICSTCNPWYRCCTRKSTKNFHFLRRSHQMLDIAVCFASSFPIQKNNRAQHVNVCRTLDFQGFYSSLFLGVQKNVSGYLWIPSNRVQLIESGMTS